MILINNLIFIIFFCILASKDHWETMKIYKEMDRQDREAAKTNSVPEYQRGGGFNPGSNNHGSSRGSNTSNNSNNTSNNGRK